MLRARALAEKSADMPRRITLWLASCRSASVSAVLSFANAEAPRSAATSKRAGASIGLERSQVCASSTVYPLSQASLYGVGQADNRSLPHRGASLCVSSRPSAFAVLRLMISSDRVGAREPEEIFGAKLPTPHSQKRSRARSPERPRKIFMGFLRPSSDVLRYCLFRSLKMKVRTSLIGLLVVCRGSP